MYVLYKFRYRQGNHPIEQSVVEIQDTGKASSNRDAAETLAKAWLLEKGLSKGYDNLRFIDCEPFVAISERPTIADIPVKADGKAQGIRPIA